MMRYQISGTRTHEDQSVECNWLSDFVWPFLIVDKCVVYMLHVYCSLWPFLRPPSPNLSQLTAPYGLP
jgi:hypothetical protein